MIWLDCDENVNAGVNIDKTRIVIKIGIVWVENGSIGHL